MIKTNKKGMTLVELMVYMVLAALLLAPVIMLVQNSSVNMARDASNVNLRMSGRELLNIIYDDLRNTGFKLNNFSAVREVSYIDLDRLAQHEAACGATPPSETIGACPASIFDSTYDISSFRPINKVNSDSYYDALTVRMGRLTGAGAWDGIDSITYNVDNRELKRTIKGKDNPNPKTVILARNVEALKFRYSEDLINWDDTFAADKDGLVAKSLVQYIKAIIVTKDNKKLSATKTTTIKLIEPEDGAAGLNLVKDDQALYERHEIVIPIPNNGLFP